MTDPAYAIIETTYEYNNESSHYVKKSDWNLACLRVYRVKENAEAEYMNKTLDFYKSHNLFSFHHSDNFDFITAEGRRTVDVFVSMMQIHEKFWDVLTGHFDEHEPESYGQLVRSVFNEMDHEQAAVLVNQIKIKPFRIIEVAIYP